MSEAAISIRDLEKTYQGGKRALDGVTLDVPRGQIFGLLGPNGAGKSTLINILAGLVNKSGGSASIWGFDIDQHPRNAKGSIGIVPQEILFDPFFTPAETLELQAGLYGVPQAPTAHDGAAARRASRGQGRRLFAHPVGRDEAAAAGRQGDGPFAADPGARRADRRASTSSFASSSGTMSAASTRRVSPSSSPPIISRKPSNLCDRIAIINHGRLIANETTRALVGMAQEKAVEVTVDRDVEARPRRPASTRSSCIGERTLAITYRKDRVNAGEVLAALQKDGLGIVDVSTREADLEDVFLNLTRATERRWLSSAFDVVIIGSGAAGLSAALNLADLKVAVLAKGGISPARPPGRRAASPRCSSPATRSKAISRTR